MDVKCTVWLKFKKYFHAIIRVLLTGLEYITAYNELNSIRR